MAGLRSGGALTDKTLCDQLPIHPITSTSLHCEARVHMARMPSTLAKAERESVFRRDEIEQKYVSRFDDYSLLSPFGGKGVIDC